MTDEPRPEPLSAPTGYGIGRGGEDPGDLVPWAQVERWIASSRNYWVVTTRADGRPHAMPVWGVWLDSAVWFSTDPASLKGRNIERDPRIVVHLESGDDVAILEGEAAPPDAAALSRFIDAYKLKYEIELGGESMGIFRLAPATVLAWREADYPSSATRWVMDGR